MLFSLPVHLLDWYVAAERALAADGDEDAEQRLEAVAEMLDR